MARASATSRDTVRTPRWTRPMPRAWAGSSKQPMDEESSSWWVASTGARPNSQIRPWRLAADGRQQSHTQYNPVAEGSQLPQCFCRCGQRRHGPRCDGLEHLTDDRCCPRGRSHNHDRLQRPSLPHRRTPICIFTSARKVGGKPWLDSEATPAKTPGGYWGTYSKETDQKTAGRFYNYSRIGRYTPEMKSTSTIRRETVTKTSTATCWPQPGCSARPRNDSMVHS